MPLASARGDTGGRHPEPAELETAPAVDHRRVRPWSAWVRSPSAPANPKGSGTPTEDPPADRTETGQWPSVEAYVQQVMLSQTEARYYTENADGTVSGPAPYRRGDGSKAGISDEGR